MTEWIERISSCLNSIYIVESMHDKKTMGDNTHKRLSKVLNDHLERLLDENPNSKIDVQL